MNDALPAPPVAREDIGLGTAYERVAIYDLFDRWSAGRHVETAVEGPLDGMAGIAGLHLMGLARRGVRVTVLLPDDEGLDRVRRVYASQGAADRLTTVRADAGATPTGTYDLVVSYNVLPYIADWRGYLRRLLATDARLFFVVVTNPVSYGTFLRRAQRVARRESVRELFDHEVTRRAVIEPELEARGRIVEHAYFDCPWWPDFLLPARKNLAGDLLAKVRRPKAVGAPGPAEGALRPFVHGEERYPFFEDAEGYEDMRRSMRLHPVFDRAPEPLARVFGHLHGYLVERRSSLEDTVAFEHDPHAQLASGRRPRRTLGRRGAARGSGARAPVPSDARSALPRGDRGCHAALRRPVTVSAGAHALERGPPQPALLLPRLRVFVRRSRRRRVQAGRGRIRRWGAARCRPPRRPCGCLPHGGARRSPLALGAFVDFGFVGNLLAFGILLASLPSLDRVARSPSPRAAARATATLVLLYAAHDSALVIGGLSIAILSLGRPLLDRSSVWRAIPVLAGAGLALGEEVIAVHRSGANLSGLPRIIDLGFDQRLRDLPEALLGLHGAQATRPACAAIGGALVVLAIEGLWRWRAALARAVTRDLYDDHRFLALGAALLAGYFVAPFAVTGAMWINARFLGPAVAVVGVALAPTLPRRPSWRVLAFACGAMVLVVALVEPGMESTAKFYEDLDGIVPAIAPGSAIAPLDLAFGGGIPANDLVLIASSAAARAASERGGRMAFSFTQASPIPPVIVAPGHRWDESFLRLAGDMLALEPSRDLRRFRYVLALAPPGQAPRLEAALAPEARLVARSGWWILFESNEDVGSLLAPEEPAHHEETLRDRLARAPGSDR